MAESDRSVHFSDSARLIDSTNLGHPDPVHDVRRFGSINDIHPSDAEHHCYQRLSNSMSSTSSSVVPLLHVYRRRWYILFIFTFFSFVQVKTLFQFFFCFSGWANVITGEKLSTCVCACLCVYIHIVVRTTCARVRDQEILILGIRWRTFPPINLLSKIGPKGLL